MVWKIAQGFRPVGIKRAKRTKPKSALDVGAAHESLAPREAAINALSAVLYDRVFLTDALETHAGALADKRGRAFAHALASITLRRKGQIESLLQNYLEKPLAARTGKARPILLAGVTQVLFMQTEAHAAIDTSVTLAGGDERAARIKGLINAVLRKIERDRVRLLADLPPACNNLPKWIHTRLRADHGSEAAALIAEAHIAEAPVDLAFKQNSAGKENEHLGTILPNGTLRLRQPHAPITDLPGYEQGNWWVQDAAATLPARLFGDIADQQALDMCAAPGGKTMQLCASGAIVTALDTSQGRLERVEQNLARTGLHARCIHIDAISFQPDQLYDAILLDAPCSASGTIRRHPDMPYVRGNEDLKGLLQTQRNLLRKAALLLKPGGTLVYAVCSLFNDEGPKQIAAFLHEHPDFSRVPVQPGEQAIPAHMITKSGDLRTMPHYQFGSTTGMDGFFAARLAKLSN